MAIGEKPCAACDGAGHLTYPDPLDLKKLREQAGFNSISAFAASVVREDGGQGVTPAFIHMIENPDTGNSSRSRRCPDWLLAQYLKPPKNVKESSTPNLRNLSSEQMREAVKKSVAVRQRKADGRQEERRQAIKPREVWQQVAPCPPIRRIRIVSIVGEAVVYRPWNNDAAPERSMQVKALLKKYQRIEG